MRNPSEKVLGRLRATGLALAAVALGLATAATPAVAASGVHRVTLAMRDFALQPTALYLKAGERVELVYRTVEPRSTNGRSAGA